MTTSLTLEDHIDLVGHGRGEERRKGVRLEVEERDTHTHTHTSFMYNALDNQADGV